MSTDAATAQPTPIRSLTVLPAHREDVELHTADGLTLVGELALPVHPDGTPKTPAATLVTLHPLPTHGGYMDSHVLRKAAWRLPALADIAVLRFNTRGTSSPRGIGGIFIFAGISGSGAGIAAFISSPSIPFTVAR